MSYARDHSPHAPNPIPSSSTISHQTSLGLKKPKFTSARKSGTYRTSFGVLDWRDWIAWRHWWKYLILLLIIIATIIMTVLHDKIVDALEPSFRALRDFPVGWLVPVLIITIISVPPLAGHEIIILLTGAVWDEHFGLIAFAIVSAGTILGEWLDYWLFKRQYFKRKIDAQIDQSLLWACMAHVCRLPGIKGVWTAFIIRLSFVPGHLTTPVFSAAGMGFRVFTIAAILSLPKQYAIVYLGTLFVQDKAEKTTTSKIITWVTLVTTAVVSLFCCWYVYWELKKAIPKADPDGRLRHALYPNDFPAAVGVTDDSRTPLTSQGATFAMSSVSLNGDPDDKRAGAGYGGPSFSNVTLNGGSGGGYGYPYGNGNASQSDYTVGGGGVGAPSGGKGGMNYSAYQPEYPPGSGAGGAAGGYGYADPYSQPTQQRPYYAPPPPSDPYIATGGAQQPAQRQLTGEAATSRYVQGSEDTLANNRGGWDQRPTENATGYRSGEATPRRQQSSSPTRGQAQAQDGRQRFELQDGSGAQDWRR